MKLAIIGSRDFNDYELLAATLDNYIIDVIISGGAKALDTDSYSSAESSEKAYATVKKWFENRSI
jgi:predicted Rossmann fold nucleotide-binding protein DprA/Smf involved in DNA uptake